MGEDMPTPYKMKLNKTALSEWRQERELTKKEMADLLKISLQYYCDLESGHRPGTPRLIAAIADQLKVRKMALIENPNDVEVAS